MDFEGFAVDPRAAEWGDFLDHYPRCPDCSREMSRLGALVAELGFESVRGAAHLGDRELVALSTAPERLHPEERERIEQHLAGCAPCRTELAVLVRFDFSALAGEEKGFARLLEALRRLGASLAPKRPRLALATALALIIAVPALLVWRMRSEGPTEGPQVARVEPEAAPPTPVIEPPPRAEPEPAVEHEAAPETVAEVTPQREPTPVPKAATEPAPRAPAQAPEARKQPVQIASLLPSEAPHYVPGALAGDTSRRVGSVTRSAGVAVPTPQVLAPPHVGRTSRPSPTLYWFLPEGAMHA